MSQQDIAQLEAKLHQISQLVENGQYRNQSEIQESDAKLRMGIDLGTSNIVTLVLDEQNNPVAARMSSADVVRDGIVWDFFGAVSIIREHYESLQALLPNLPQRAVTSFPPGTEPRISANVLDAAGIEVKGVIDEPSAVAHLLNLDNVGIVDIGGGTTGVAIIKDNVVVFSADEATGGHHISLTLSGNRGMTLEEAEIFKKTEGEMAWTIAKPVFEKMCSIVERLLNNREIETLYLSGGTCMMPGVLALFSEHFPHQTVILPNDAIFLTPYAIAAYCGEE